MSEQKTVAMKSAKEQVADLLRELPDEVTMDEIQYRLYVRAKIERGLRESEAGVGLMTTEEVRTRLRNGLLSFMVAGSDARP